MESTLPPSTSVAPPDPRAFGHVDRLVDEIGPRLADTRRLFHMYPEVAWKERGTAERIAKILSGLAVPFRVGLAGGNGLLVDIEGAHPGPTILYRADIDALPIREANEADYRSRHEGVMHACGHDAHITVGLGLVEVLYALRGQFSGRVRVLFQPAEEDVPSGAMAMIRDGVLDGVSAAWAIHVDPTLDPRTFGLKMGVLTAAVDMYKIDIRGQSAHSARPHLGIDAVLLASRVVSAIYQTIAVAIDPYKTGVLNVGMIHGGEAPNVIADRVELKGTFRSFDPEVREIVPQRLQAIARGIVEPMGGTMAWEYHPGPPSVMNDETMIALTERAVVDAFGLAGVQHLSRPSTGGDDFAWYGGRIPMCMVRAGCRVGEGHGLHTPKFDVADATLAASVRVMARAMLLQLQHMAPAAN